VGYNDQSSSGCGVIIIAMIGIMALMGLIFAAEWAFLDYMVGYECNGSGTELKFQKTKSSARGRLYNQDLMPSSPLECRHDDNGAGVSES